MKKGTILKENKKENENEKLILKQNSNNKDICELIDLLFIYELQKEDRENTNIQNLIEKINNTKSKIIFPRQYLLQKYFEKSDIERENLRVCRNYFYQKYIKSGKSKIKFVLNTIEDIINECDSILGFIYRESDKFLENNLNKIGIDDLESKIDNIKKDLKETEKNMINQIISLIAIFTTLAFLLFGGISFLTELLKQFKDTEESKILFISCCWGICFSGVFYMFIYFIFCMIGKEDKIQNIKRFFGITIAILSIIGILSFTLVYKF